MLLRTHGEVPKEGVTFSLSSPLPKQKFKLKTHGRKHKKMMQFLSINVPRSPAQ